MTAPDITPIVEHALALYPAHLTAAVAWGAWVPEVRARVLAAAEATRAAGYDFAGRVGQEVQHAVRERLGAV